MRILLVESDSLLGDTIHEALNTEGYASDWLVNDELVIPSLLSGAYDLLILGDHLPEGVSVEMLNGTRGASLSIPILMLSAGSLLTDKLPAISKGAFDSLTKPFDMDELFARINALLCVSGTEKTAFKSGDLILDVAEHTVLYEGQKVENLTAKEFAILEVLLRNKGCFITKHRLLDSCVAKDQYVASSTIDADISRLCERVGPGAIETLRGIGYRVKC